MTSLRNALMHLLALYGLAPRPAPRRRSWIQIGPAH